MGHHQDFLPTIEFFSGFVHLKTSFLVFAVFTLLSPLFLMAVQSISVFHFRPHFLFSTKEEKKKFALKKQEMSLFLLLSMFNPGMVCLYGRHEGTNVQLGKERSLWWGFSIAILCSLFLEFTLIKEMSLKKIITSVTHEKLDFARRCESDR